MESQQPQTAKSFRPHSAGMEANNCGSRHQPLYLDVKISYHNPIYDLIIAMLRAQEFTNVANHK